MEAENIPDFSILRMLGIKRTLKFFKKLNPGPEDIAQR